MIRSHSLLISDFDSDWYKRWAKELKQNKNNLENHSLKANKFWQNAVMTQILFEKNMLKKGQLGLGFGVGRERLPALFANKDVKITATDQDFRKTKAKLWQQNELAHDEHSLNNLSIASKEKFSKNVSFKAVDMKKIPKNFFGKYDFLWSNCALGHLGSIDAGLDFIVNSAKCLKPDGYAIHTTEVNVLNNKQTVTGGDTVIFRPKDIYELSKKLEKAGFKMDPLKLTFGNTKYDKRIAMHPEYGNAYSKIHFKGHLLTQVVLVIKNQPVKSHFLYKLIHRYYYFRNILIQKSFAGKKSFLKNINNLNESILQDDSIISLKNSVSIKLASKPKYIYLEYKNKTDKNLYSLKNKSDGSWPICLATTSPTDRESVFISDDWPNNQANRPSDSLFEKTKKGKWNPIKFVEPNAEFAFRVRLSPENVKKGNYTEKFGVVQEGIKHLPKTSVKIDIKVI